LKLASTVLVDVGFFCFGGMMEDGKLQSCTIRLCDGWCFRLVQWEGFYIFTLQQLFQFVSVYIDLVSVSIPFRLCGIPMETYASASGTDD